mgnify:CR=1 FL=1
MADAFKLPELGENVEAGTVTKVMIDVGDHVEIDQPVLEIETDKAVLEVPSGVAGEVSKLLAKEGAEIRVGDPVFEYSANGKSPAKDDAPKEDAPKDEPPKDEAPKKEVAPKESKSKDDGKDEAPAKKASEKAAERDDDEARSKERDEDAKAWKSQEDRGEEERPRRRSGGPVPAAPSVRGFAREIGIDINDVNGTGPGGRISLQDVKDHARGINTDVRGLVATAPASPTSTAVNLPDFSRWGEVEYETMSGVRRRTAENMSLAWTTIPQVTQFDKADVTELDNLRKQFTKQVEAEGGKLTMTAIIVKVIAAALKKFPQFNSSVDMASNEIIYKKYYNIGVAVDTDRGLLVPVVRDVDQKNLTELSIEITELAERARNRKTKLEEMQGGTFTVSNLGGLGGTGFSPIVNAPEVAILGIARTQVEPVYVDGNFRPSSMLPLSLSYDHRVIDGADGARFLRWVCQALQQPFLLFLEG